MPVRIDVRLYFCGPMRLMDGLVDAVIGTAPAQGWSDSQVQHESFAGAQRAVYDTPFDVRIASLNV